MAATLRALERPVVVETHGLAAMSWISTILLAGLASRGEYGITRSDWLEPAMASRLDESGCGAPAPGLGTSAAHERTVGAAGVWPAHVF